MTTAINVTKLRKNQKIKFGESFSINAFNPIITEARSKTNREKIYVNR